MAEKEGENGRMRKRKGGSKWLKGKRGGEREREEGGREGESMGDAATVRLKP